MKNIKSLTIGLVVVTVLCASFVLRDSKSRIAYVRSEVLIYKYDGTRDAQMKFSKMQGEWKANLDTLQSEFKREMAAFNKGQSTMTAKDREDTRKRLISKDRQLEQYSKALADKIDQSDAESMQSVLNQINSFTERYAKENGYDLILGTSESGNVLYGKTSLDITQELLDALNKEYNGQ